MAFMIVASGLDSCDLSADINKQLAYTHLDIAGSSIKPVIGNGIPEPTGIPMASLVQSFCNQ